MIKLPIFIVLWVGFLMIKIPTLILGWFIVPFLWQYRNDPYELVSKYHKWTRPWLNPEDWQGGPQSYENSLPRWWAERESTDFKSFWKYHAIRNPANGLRSIEWLDLDIVPKKVEYKASGYLRHYAPWYMRKEFPEVNTYWYLCWQGYQAGFKYVHHWNNERHLVIKFGWRIQPSDAVVGPDPDGIRFEDSGFATKFLMYREG